ncbi:hypothetical protein Tco_0561660 [Tanacetum coccineum]
MGGGQDTRTMEIRMKSPSCRLVFRFMWNCRQCTVVRISMFFVDDENDHVDVNGDDMVWMISVRVITMMKTMSMMIVMLMATMEINIGTSYGADEPGIIPYQWPEEQDAVLAEDTIVERKTSSTRRGVRKSYRIRRKGQRPSASKWFSKEVGEAQFPHFHF